RARGAKDRGDRAAGRHPVHGGPAEDALGQDHAPPAAGPGGRARARGHDDAGGSGGRRAAQGRVRGEGGLTQAGSGTGAPAATVAPAPAALAAGRWRMLALLSAAELLAMTL